MQFVKIILSIRTSIRYLISGPVVIQGGIECIWHWNAMKMHWNIAHVIFWNYDDYVKQCQSKMYSFFMTTIISVNNINVLCLIYLCLVLIYILTLSDSHFTGKKKNNLKEFMFTHSHRNMFGCQSALIYKQMYIWSLALNISMHKIVTNKYWIWKWRVTHPIFFCKSLWNGSIWPTM